MNTGIYWRIRDKILNFILKFKSIQFFFDKKRQSFIEHRTFFKLLLFRFAIGVTKGIILVFIFDIIDVKLLEFGFIKFVNNDILANLIIGELGVAGVVLGLYYSNISSIYTTRYVDAPKDVANAFQYDKLTTKCLNTISNFIVYGTLILSKLLMGYYVGWLSSGILIVLSIIVVFSFGIVGNRIYQLSDVFKVSNDVHTILRRIISKNLINKLYIADINFQKYFCNVVSDNVRLLKSIQKYGSNLEPINNSSMLDFMRTNILLINDYWEVKRHLPKDSFWFRRKGVYQKWHFANSIEITTALNAGTALSPKDKPDYHWFEDQLISINHACINYLINKNDFETLYNYLAVFGSICNSSIFNKEADYYIREVEWIKNNITGNVDRVNEPENKEFIAIIEYVSLLYLDIIIKSSKFCKDLNINEISKTIINEIDSGKSCNYVETIRGREFVDVYKKILTEVYVEGHRITPDWLIKQYAAKEEYIYLNSLYDVIKECIEHTYSLGKFFIDNDMYYEACIILIKLYEYESKISHFNICAEQAENELKECIIDTNNNYLKSRLGGVNEAIIKYKDKIPNMLAKCSSAFAIKNWDMREEYPDFLGECYNHIAVDTVESIINSDKKLFESNYESLTIIILLYQEYIRSDFVKNGDLYRVEYAYNMITSPVIEWAQIGGLGIIWGEFFKDKEWYKIVRKSLNTILYNKDNDNNTRNLANNLVEFATKQKNFKLGVDARDFLKTNWNQSIVLAINESAEIEIEYSMYEKVIKTDSNLIKAFCHNFVDFGFTNDPSEIFWILCINPLVSEDKRFRSIHSWEKKLNEY